MTKKNDIMWEEIFFVEEEIDDENDGGGFDDNHAQETPDIIKMMNPNHNVVQTPFGAINTSDPTSPVYNTRFFVGHTNFDLTKESIDAIYSVAGVEFLKRMGRYRFIIGVGVLFNSEETHVLIENKLKVTRVVPIDTKPKPEQLTDFTEDQINDIDSAIKAVLNQIPKDSKWIAYVFPNGEHIIKVVGTDEEIENKKQEFEKLLEMSHGQILAYND